jgi:hypothetical protein
MQKDKNTTVYANLSFSPSLHNDFANFVSFKRHIRYFLLKDTKLAKSGAKGQKYNNIRYFVFFPSLHNGFIKKIT